MPSFSIERLLKRKEEGNLRELRLFPSHRIDFASNDYLGLARSQQLEEQAVLEWEKGCHQGKRLGATGSRLLTGNSLYAQELEDQIAHFHGYEAGLLFNCGYMANVGLLSAILQKQDLLLFDAQLHASAYDGMRLSQAQAFPFRHYDLEHLEKRLKGISRQGRCFIWIESIDSTDGSQAPLQETCCLAKQYGAYLIIDEAHAVGVCGPQGRGRVAEYSLTKDVFAQVVTFGKALGCYGAIVLGSYHLKQLLINFSRPFIYTTALPFPCLAAIKCSYRLFPSLEKERQHLNHLIQQFSQAFAYASSSCIQPIFIKGNQAVKEKAQVINQQGFDVRPILSPTVQKGKERLRLCLHAFNSEQEVTDLLHLLLNGEKNEKSHCSRHWHRGRQNNCFSDLNDFSERGLLEAHPMWQ